jgi:hypothetical protein
MKGDAMAIRRLTVLTLIVVLCAAGGASAGGKIEMLDKDGLAQGTVSVNLEKGSVKAKLTLLPLPATIDTGTEQFEATIYKAYLVNSQDAAVEVPLGNVYPSTKEKAKIKFAVKGDLSQMGLDRVVVVAFSKDGLHSFDVLTGTLEVQ